MDVCNVSMGTTKKNFFAALHELADKAYFQNTVLVTAANNMPEPSFPSLYSSVVSVASHEGQDPYLFYYNPAPPVEFGAPGIDVRVAWAKEVDHRDRQQLRRPPHLRHRRQDPRQAPGPHPVPDEDRAQGALGQHAARGAANRQVASPDG